MLRWALWGQKVSQEHEACGAPWLSASVEEQLSRGAMLKQRGGGCLSISCLLCQSTAAGSDSPSKVLCCMQRARGTWRVVTTAWLAGSWYPHFSFSTGCIAFPCRKSLFKRKIYSVSRGHPSTIQHFSLDTTPVCDSPVSRACIKPGEQGEGVSWSSITSRAYLGHPSSGWCHPSYLPSAENMHKSQPSVCFGGRQVVWTSFLSNLTFGHLRGI